MIKRTKTEKELADMTASELANYVKPLIHISNMPNDWIVIVKEMVRKLEGRDHVDNDKYVEEYMEFLKVYPS